jgi:hypothetical protein
VGHEHVLGDRQVGEDQRLLVDGDDAVALRLGGGVDVRRLPVDRHLSVIGTVETGHDLDERRLAGAVLAEQRMHLSAVQGDVRFVERERSPEALGDPVHRQHDVALALGVRCHEILPSSQTTQLSSLVDGVHLKRFIRA